MTAPIKKALDAAVAKKAITAAREKQILSRYTSSLSARINQKGLGRPRRAGSSAEAAPAAEADPARGIPTGAAPAAQAANGQGNGNGPSFVPPSASPRPPRRRRRPEPRRRSCSCRRPRRSAGNRTGSDRPHSYAALIDF